MASMVEKNAQRKKKDNERIQTLSALETEYGQLKAKVKELNDLNTNLQESNDELMQTNQNLRAQIESQADESLENLNKLSINSPGDATLTDNQDLPDPQISDEQASAILGSDLHEQINN